MRRVIVPPQQSPLRRGMKAGVALAHVLVVALGVVLEGAQIAGLFLGVLHGAAHVAVRVLEGQGGLALLAVLLFIALIGYARWGGPVR